MPFDVAQICLNGHIINTTSRKYPESNSAYCGTCGEPTITTCQNHGCNAAIRGAELEGFSLLEIVRPAFCLQCGKPYPWTERSTKAAAELLIEATGFSGDQAAEVRGDVQEVVKNSPQAQVAATRLSRVLKKVGQPIGNIVKDTLASVISEAAKKIIWPT